MPQNSPKSPQRPQASPGGSPAPYRAGPPGMLTAALLQDAQGLLPPAQAALQLLHAP